MAHEDRDKPEGSVSRRAFLKGSAIATGALSSVLIPAVTEAQLPDAVEPDPRHSIVSLKVNGVAYRKEVPNRTTLLQFLREDLKLTGTKMGCDRLQCGACTVVLNGKNVYSCTTLAVEASASFGWDRWADDSVSIDHFGASAPGKVALENFGYTATNVAERARQLVAELDEEE